MTDGSHGHGGCHHVPGVVLHSIGKEGEGRVEYSHDEEDDDEEGTVHLVEDRLMEVELQEASMIQEVLG